MIAGEHRLALPAGYQLGKYSFKDVLGAGGFGITYLAEDSSLGRRVAIKELLPNDIATRLDGSTVVAKTRSEEGNLAWARDRFVKEGRALAACEHPNVVHVYEMVEANGTAYMVTKFEEGRSLSEWLKEVGGAPTEKELRSILMPLLSGLERVHKSGFLHRDLKPENIYITDDGRPILLDFGSARQAINDRTTSLTSIVTSGYAPFEQYHEDGKQGPWTDLYALAAVMYRAIHGKKPPEATRRLQDDPCVRLSREYAGKYSARFLSGIDKALAVEASKRPQSVAEWRESLGVAPADDKIVHDPEWVKFVAAVQEWVGKNPLFAAGGAAGAVLLLVLLWKVLSPPPVPVRPIADSTPAPIPPVSVTPVPLPPVVVDPPTPATPPPIVEKSEGGTPAKEPTIWDTFKKFDPKAGPDPAQNQRGPKVGEKWTNSLGQIYAWVPGLPMHMAVWETRRGDFEAFVRATAYDATAGVMSWTSRGFKAQGASWASPGFSQTPAHPVVGVNAYDALEFCRWLTDKDRAAGLIDERLAYRLPTETEWRKAVQAWRFPWGDAWPPTIGAGNYAGEENKTAWGSSRVISGYRDGQTATAPVGAFQANAAGFFDMGGNAIEICGSWIQNDSGSEPTIALLGASWMTAKPEALQLDARDFMRPQDRFLTVGFRCILAPVAGSDAFVLPPLPRVAQDLPPGAEAFDKKLIGIWEAKSPSPAGTVTWRWEQESDGNYTLAGPVSDAGHLTASGGRMQQVSELTGLKTAVTYKFNTSTQMVTHGPLGEATWKRISSTTTKARELARNNADSGEEKNDGGQPVARERTVDRDPAPKPKPKPKPAPNIERRAKEFGNSMRRRLGF